MKTREVEEARKAFMEAFQRIDEYIVGQPGVVEADDAPEQEEDPQGAGPDMGGQGGPEMGGAPDMGGAPGGPDMGGQGGPDMGGAPAGPDMGGQGGNPPQGLNPQGGPDMGGAPMDGGMDMGNTPEMGAAPDMGENPDVDTLQPEDEVIDVTEITDSQEDIEQDIAKINKNYKEVLKQLGQFTELLRNSNKEIADLKNEFEKRNPTNIEKLNMQTASSYPFDTKPAEFWTKKEATSNYSVGPDNNGRGMKQYVITKGDMDAENDYRTIAKSLRESNSVIFNQTLENLLK